MTLPPLRLFVGGVWEKGTGAPITSHDPLDWSVIGTLDGASAADGERAIARAEAAQPAWGAALAHERAAVLRRIGDGIEAQADRISAIQTRDTGKTRAETRALALSAAGTFRYVAALAETAEDAVTPRRGLSTTFSLHEPIGVTAAITPWNSPIASDAQKVAPSLAAGNAVLLKPASWAPLTALVPAEIAERAGLPPGLLSVLPGAGRDIGSVLVQHPAIGRVAFTGGTETGRRIAAQAAAKLMPVSLELGGKSPVAVFADADVPRALAGVLFGIFSSSGQSCIAGSRLFVEARLYDDFRDRLVAAARAMKVGDPSDPATRVGPLIHPDHHAAVAAHLDRARADGGRVLCGGPGAGRVFRPAIVEGLPNDAALCRDEVFGPVLSLLPFRDEADLIAQGNASAYGLAAGIWTRDFDRAWRIARAWRAGTVWINTYKQFSASTPFGADGDSGLGREKGPEGLRVWQRQKGIYADLTGTAIPWAAT